jgi:hypothetical protein
VHSFRKREREIRGDQVLRFVTQLVRIIVMRVRPPAG